MTDHSVKRNYYGWPLVMPPGAGPLIAEERSNGKQKWWYSKEAEAYGRASGIGKYLDDANNLIPWAASQAAVGVLLDQSARSEIVALINEFEKDPWGNGGKDRLKRAVDKARVTAGSEVASTAGTEFHGYTELLDMGREPSFIQEEYKPLVEKYREATAEIEWLHAEPFVVNDTLKVAGSIDRVARLPESWDHPLAGKVAIVDLKTGRHDPRYPLKPTLQVAAYAGSVLYDQATGERKPIHEELDQDFGVLMHFPIMADNPRVQFYPLDLRFGRQAAAIALWVKELRKLKALEAIRVG